MIPLYLRAQFANFGMILDYMNHTCIALWA